MLWLIRPAAIGGGDWKLMAALGCAIGLADPVFALMMSSVACVVHLVYAVLSRRRTGLPFAPALAAGFFMAVAAFWLLGHTSGGALL